MKTDFKKTLDCYRARAQELRVLEVPPLHYLAVDGRGDPGAEEYAAAVAALFPVAYQLKFASKAMGRDHVVMPLEALWWADDWDAFTSARDKSRWQWTAMIMVPEWTTEEMVATAVAAVAAKGSGTPSALPEVRLETLEEGLCVQTLHVGPYEDETEVLARMHREFIPGNGLRMRGKHHEVYLNDARKVAAEKLRTILRQPVERAA